jgi:general secretion pathway protein K
VIVVAMLIVALATGAAAVLLQQQDLAIRQLESARDYEQARWVLRGSAQWARTILLQDGRANRSDHRGELWATVLPPTQIEQGTLAGQIRDQQGLFNLNNLAIDGKASAPDVAVLRRLLGAIGLREDLADALADWIDADNEVTGTAGAEDAYYIRLPVPYRTANRPLSQIDELVRVRGFDEASLAKLRQFSTALPTRTAVNVNLAPPEVLVAIVEGLQLTEALVLAHGIRAAPLTDRNAFRARLPRRDLIVAEGNITVESIFFLAEGRAQVGKANVRMETLIHRVAPNVLPSIVWQRMP